MGLLSCEFAVEVFSNNDLCIRRRDVVLNKNIHAELFDFIRKVNVLMAKNDISKENAREILAMLEDLDRILGLDLRPRSVKLSKEIKDLIRLREKYRKERQWGKADKIRADLKKKGYILEDSEEGVRVKKI